MYEAFFQLRERPFTAAPQSSRFFPAGAIESARRTLERIVERSEGAGLVIGPSGTGKTLLCQALASTFRERLSVTLLSSGRLCTRRALLQAILFELRLPYRGLEEGELRLSLIDHLTPESDVHPGLLLLVDEAHTLPVRLLEELRTITNLVRGGQPQVRLVLAGGPALEERFASPKLDSFSQRIAARCYLGNFSREETANYIRYQIMVAGGDPQRAFDAAACASVYTATDGVPRLASQLCDHALILGALAEQRPVTAAIVEEAWADLQQLPTPWQAVAAAGDAGASVVEFAELDAPADSFPAIPLRSRAASFAAAAPDEQLDRIERQLSAVDDDFQPAGSIGPEMEFGLDDCVDPFRETFDEEEVVIDRYASLEADLFGERPMVESREGGELSKLLAPWTSKAAGPTLSMDAAADGARQSAGAASDVAPSEAALAMTASLTKAAAAAFDAAPDDLDLIVVEEDAAVAIPPPASLVRRQEYRQLFARMRRG